MRAIDALAPLLDKMDREENVVSAAILFVKSDGKPSELHKVRSTEENDHENLIHATQYLQHVLYFEWFGRLFHGNLKPTYWWPWIRNPAISRRST